MAGTKKEDIVGLAYELLNDEEKYQQMSRAINPYGDGHASERIIDEIVRYIYKR